MNFKELKKGFPVFILNTDTIEYYQGRVNQDATPPRVGSIIGGSMVVDVSIESNNATKIWTLPADQKVAEMQNDSNVIISTDKNTIIAMIKSINQECENYLQGIDIKKKKLKLTKDLIAELDVVYKQQQQTEERFDKIEKAIGEIHQQLGSVKTMENTLSEILKAVK